MVVYRDIGVPIAVLAWYAFIWWMARRDQDHPTWSPAVRVRLGPDWLLWLCGAHGKSESLHVPMALAQLTAITACLLSIALTLLLPPSGRSQVALSYLAMSPFAMYAMGYAVMYTVGVLQRRWP